MRFFTALEKKEFRSSALPLSSIVILLSSNSVIFSFDFHLSESNGLTVLHNCLLSAVPLSFKFEECFFLVFRSKETQKFCCLV